MHSIGQIGFRTLNLFPNLFDLFHLTVSESLCLLHAFIFRLVFLRYPYVTLRTVLRRVELSFALFSRNTPGLWLACFRVAALSRSTPPELAQDLPGTEPSVGSNRQPKSFFVLPLPKLVKFFACKYVILRRRKRSSARITTDTKRIKISSSGNHTKSISDKASFHQTK